MGEFQGKVVIVTGGAGILGRAVAAAFADANARVVLSDRSASPGAEVAGDLKARGDVRFIPADPADPGDAERLASDVESSLGRIDVLAHLGFTQSRLPALDMPAAAWRADLDAGLSAALFMGQAAARRMARTGGGSVVSVTSVDVEEGTPGRATAAAAAGALLGLTRVLAAEWASLGIRVNAVVPCVLHEEPERAAIERGEKSVERVRLRAPAHRLGNAEEIARAVLFLSGPRSSFITGQALFADGGWNAFTMHPDGMKFP